jgi:multiple sugar transport system ATP-binding protein
MPARDGAVAFGSVPVHLPPGVNGRDEVIVGVRPEALELASEGLDGAVEVVEELGADAFVFCSAELPDGPGRLVARVDARRAPARGERVRLRPSSDFTPHLFDAETGRRLGD